jgi:exopolysaccharide biosynthesis protein
MLPLVMHRGRMHARALLAALVAAYALVPAGLARAWPHEGTEVHPGVIYRRFSGPIEIPGSGVSDQEIFVAYVDTADPRVSFVATRMDARMRTVSSFAAATGAEVAINTNYFAGGGQSCGLMVGEGGTWTDSYHLPSRCSDSIGFSGRTVSFFDSFDILNGPPPAGVTEVATGMPTVVRDGAVVDQAIIESSDYPSHMGTANPRTGVCMHEDGRTLVLIVVDGRAPGRTGMRGITFGRFARHVLGCRHAVMLDGGGSSELFVRGQPGFEGRPDGVVNRTSDGRERVVCCHLGVRVDESVVPDAGPPPIDAAVVAEDAAVEAPDAATMPFDAGVALDAGTGADVGPRMDAASVDRDAGRARTSIEGACGCRVVGGAREARSGLATLTALVLVALVRRRRGVRARTRGPRARASLRA